MSCWSARGGVPSRRKKRQGRSSPAKEPEVDLERESREFQASAPVVGFCGACGVSVNEPAGDLHAHDCPYLPAHRRRSK